jgi:hypothetical protein
MNRATAIATGVVASITLHLALRVMVATRWTARNHREVSRATRTLHDSAVRRV